MVCYGILRSGQLEQLLGMIFFPPTCYFMMLYWIQLFRERLSEKMCTRQSRKVMGYDQYTVPDDCSCRTCFCCIPLALANIRPWPFVTILSNFFEKQRTQNNPQCLSGLSRALFPTTFLEIAVYKKGLMHAQSCFFAD